MPIIPRLTVPLASLVALVAAACERDHAAPWAGDPTVVAGDTAFRFPSGVVFVPGFKAVAYIGQIPAARKAPFIVLEGVECGDCDAPPSVLVRSPSDGPAVPDTALPGWFAYPGPIREWESKAVVSDSRLFWGACLPGGGSGLVQFATDSAGGPALGRVAIAEVRGDTIRERQGTAAEVPLAVVVEQVRRGRCREIPPRAQVAF